MFARLFAPVVRSIHQFSRTLPRLAVCGFCLFIASTAYSADDDRLGPDSQRQSGVPRGKVTQHRWKQSKVFEGT
ncbi:MAG: hypothetical protein ACREJM_16190, partial [Candidatus Saccharimonadales bacterium]